MRTIFASLLLVLAMKAFSKTPQGTFKENKGQVHDQNNNLRPDVLFSGTTGNLMYHLRNNGVSYQMYNANSIYRIDVNWIGARSLPTIVKGKEKMGAENFSSRGIYNVKSYSSVDYRNIYKDIDLVWYCKNGKLEYDYFVGEGADYKQIQLQFEGADKVWVNDKGQLVIDCKFGQIIEEAPSVFQSLKDIDAKWIVKDNVVSFEIEGLEKDKPFIIDPTVAARMWGTYYGGAGDETANSTCTDASGNVYITGVTTTSLGTSIATSGSHQTFFGTGNNDAFLAKFNSNGTRLWATYYGDAGDEAAYAVTSDGTNVFISGITGSSGGTAIATAVSHQNYFGGGNYDCFLAKFDGSGVRQWATYYGGVADEFAYGLSTDASGNIYMAGYTSSTGSLVIATNGAHQTVKSAGTDAFLVKFNAAGVRQWGTYYGGSGPEWGYACATDAAGNVYLAGATGTAGGTVIATASGFQPAKGASNDAYLVQFNSSGVRQWGTYYGGSGNDLAYACATDVFGNIFLNGVTSSSGGTSIATTNAHQNTFGGINDAYVAKFNAAGMRQWGTYYGGTANELAFTGVCTDNAGNVYFGGTTATSGGTVMATIGSYEETFGGGTYDAYLVKLDSAGVRQWGTYYGGTGDEKGMACAKDNAGNVFLCGSSTSTTGILVASAGSHQSSFGGGTNDAFLVKFTDCTIPTSPTITANPSSVTICYGGSATLTAAGSGTVNWFSSPTGGSNLSSGNNYIVSPTVTTSYYAENMTCAPSATRTSITVTVNPVPTVSIASTNTVVCASTSETLTASGASAYSWNTGATTAAIIISPTVTTTYTVTGTMNGCSNMAVITESLSSCIGIAELLAPNAQLSIYPNPSSGKFTIISNQKMDMNFINEFGQNVKTISVSENKNEISVADLSPGIYFIISKDDKTIRQKIVILK